MTTEEKARAYDEALKQAKKFHTPDSNNSNLKAVLEAIFPKLGESEDERIRKMLINYFSDDDTTNGISNSSIRAYLEKQKEQKPEEKPINWTELTWEDINELEGIINNVHYEFRNGIGEESFGKEVLEKFREYKGDEYLDEIEQKPAEWGEEDKEMKSNIIRTLQYMLENHTLDEGLKKIIQDEINWLKSLCPQPHWKPSEEQMEALDNAQGELCSTEYNEGLCSLIDNLKKL